MSNREPTLSLLQSGALFAGFAAVGFALLWPALNGSFINDDYPYILNHPYLNPLDAKNLIAILDPFGPAMLHGVNYAPVQLLAHALERMAFGQRTLGYHVTNVLVHAGNCVLLVALLHRSRVPLLGALLGGLVFATHPANVEVVAWMSQLKTSLAFACSLGAVLAHTRMPKTAALLFAVGLLSKASAAAALPFAAGLCWARGGSRRDWAWLGVWLGLFALFAIPEVRAHRYGGGVDVEAYSDLRVHLQTIAAIGARYLVMAASSIGIGAFQEVDPVRSASDPWVIAGLGAGVLFGARTIVAVRGRREEAAYWLLAAASFVPVSQISPFLNQMADRYLYFVLPGLIGGAWLFALELRGRWLSPERHPRAYTGSTRAAIAVCVVASLGFAVRAHARAPLWTEEIWLVRDSALRFPTGGTAAYWRAAVAAQQADAETVVAELRTAASRNLGFVRNFSEDPAFARVRGRKVFHDLVDDIALRWIEYARDHRLETQPWLRSVANAHLVRGEYDQAIEYFERSARAEGPLRPLILAEMEAARASRRDAQREAADGAN